MVNPVTKIWLILKNRKFFIYLVVNFNCFLKKENLDQDLDFRVLIFKK